MRNKMCKTLPLAIAVLLAGVGIAFAGQNADVVFTLDSPAEFAGIGPGDNSVTFTISAAEVVGVKQYDVTVKITPAEAFDLNATTFAPGNPAFLVPGKEVNIAAGTVKIGAANLMAQADGSLILGTFTFTTAAGFTAGTEATIEAILISLGPSSTDRDAFAAEALAAMGLSAMVNPPGPAPTIESIAPNQASQAGGIEATITGSNFQDGATVTIGGNPATATFVSATTLTVIVPAGSLGAADVVVTNPDAKSATLTGGFTYVAVVEPTLVATTAADISRDYSTIGEGQAADGSAGEVTFAVQFTDNTGALAAGQTVSWLITNLGSEPVYVLGATVAEIVAGAALTVEVATDASGIASILLDAEGDRMAGTTSVSVAASTTAPNSEGVSRSLSREFSATWDVPVAAELAGMWGTVTPNQVLLQWSVASQSNNLGWEVFRSTDNIAFERVGDLVPGDGTSDEFKTYRFVDNELPQVEVLYYYLSQIDLNGSRARSEVIEVALATVTQPLPVATALLQNFPNPFNPETTIRFELSETAVVTLTVYDLTGQVVRTLIGSQVMTAGNYRQLWDGRNESGVMVGSGVYFYQLNAGTFRDAKKMILLQ